MSFKDLNPTARTVFESGGVFVPSPLALDENNKHHEAYQRLLTLYYIKSGAKAVIPGAHTGEFALNDIELFERWMLWIKEMTLEYGDQMVLMAMIGGPQALQQAELAAKHGYQSVMIAPTAFARLADAEIIALFENVAGIIPTFAFELQQAIPGSYNYSSQTWSKIFEIVYGAKGASFDTYRSLVMLEAAANSERRHQLTLFTGNDDRIVADLLGSFSFKQGTVLNHVEYTGGLLGHFATDTKAAVKWFTAIKKYRENGDWVFDLTKDELAHGVNRCNMVLFDALNNFENSVWGVKYRLSSQGLLPGPFCMHEHGSKEQARQIDQVYGEYTELSDSQILSENIEELKKEVGIY